jgi:hypothetical protein
MANHRKQKYLSPDVNGQTLKASLGTAEHIKMHKIDPAPQLLPQTDRQTGRQTIFKLLLSNYQKGGEQKNNKSYSPLTESCRIHVYVLQHVIYMVRCDVQRWDMEKQIDATRYIVP